MRKPLILCLVVALALILSNFTIVGALFGKPLVHVYDYQSTDLGFKEIEVPEKGRDLDLVNRSFQQYKLATGHNNSQLRRTTKRNPLLFYEWYDYLTNERWQYEYMSPN